MTDRPSLSEALANHCAVDRPRKPGRTELWTRTREMAERVDRNPERLHLLAPADQLAVEHYRAFRDRQAAGTADNENGDDA